MTMVLQIKGKASLLEVQATGTFSLESAQRTFLEMLDAAVMYHADKILFDGQALAGKPELMERFIFGEFAANSVADYGEKGLAPAVQFAYVLKEPVRDPKRFGEIVALNRGMRVKVFGNTFDARDWLKVHAVTTRSVTSPLQQRLSGK